ncbi:hypothetical protein [Frankia sp. AgB32]|uniref:hypothetical protein n=1 Tax=Frankia sp. AgB32 TaxID=631119 RepID=UPI00200F960C|nr:hypothetical protein [Frankia sp. AgB32]MCK9893844.1 hypothetical protein [Frankia sp. AgB32]
MAAEPDPDLSRESESPPAATVPASDAEGGQRRRRGHAGRRRSAIIATVTVLVVLGAAVTIGLTVAGGSHSDGPARPRPTGSGPARSGGPGTSALPSAAGTLDAADAGLLAALRPFVVTDCQPGARDGTGVTAALRCAPGAGAVGSPTQLSIVRYADASALRADVSRRSAALTDTGDCRLGQTSVEHWAHSSRRSGTILCEATPTGFTITWTIDAELLGLTAEAADPTRLFAWWRTFSPV